MASQLVIRPPKAPNLLLAPLEHSQQYTDQLNNALRLYFNQIDNSLGALLSSTGGGGLSLPFIAASDTADQLATQADTPTIVKWNTLEGGNGFTLNAPGSATALVSGIYKITYSLQFVNTDNAIHNAAVWLKVNNVDVPRSTTVFTLQARKSAGVYNFLCGYSEVVFSLNAGDVLELYWAVDQAYRVSPARDGIYMEFLAAQTVPYARPSVPSAIGSITFVSRLPSSP
jgi:hypothetical protein